MVVGQFTEEVDTLVIGGGPGGYVAAIRAAELGQQVTLIERDKLGGVCLNVGCIPSKALITSRDVLTLIRHAADFGVAVNQADLDFAKVQDRKNSVVQQLTSGVASLLKAHHVNIVSGEAFFVAPDTVKVNHGYESSNYRFNHCILAVGSTPIEIPGFSFSDRVLSSTGALDLKEVPKKLVVIGGGYIGMELSGAYAAFGTEVTILEGTDAVLPAFDKDLVRPVLKAMKEKGVQIYTGARAKQAKETGDGVTVTAEIKGEVKEFAADYVLVTVGRHPNTRSMGLDLAEVAMDARGFVTVDKQGRTSSEKIFAIGDIVKGMALAHKASYEGKVAAEAISGQNAAVDYLAMPAVVFTEPEIATVGLSAAQAEDKGYAPSDLKVNKFPFAANGRALTLNNREGFVTLVTRKSDHLLLGAQIVGTHASDLITEYALAIESGMNAEDVALTVHPHPTLSEMAMEVSELNLGFPTHTL